MISTVSPPEISVKRQEIVEKKQVKEELMTETAKFRSKKTNSQLELATWYMSSVIYQYNF